MRNALLISNGLGRPASFYALLRGIRGSAGRYRRHRRWVRRRGRLLSLAWFAKRSTA